MADWADGPRQSFPMWKNEHARTDNHPSDKGKIEFKREFWEALLAYVKAGEMPVVEVAMW